MRLAVFAVESVLPYQLVTSSTGMYNVLQSCDLLNQQHELTYSVVALFLLQ